jgi:hypothetical protein
MNTADLPIEPTREAPTEHALGDEPAVTGDGLHLTVHRLGRRSITGAVDLPGEFDLPPEEPVTVLGPVPWELQEDPAEDDLAEEA